MLADTDNMPSRTTCAESGIFDLQNIAGKVADIYTKPASLREHLQDKKNLGTFPLHRFWGPGTSIESSKWIADASIAVDKKHNPTLTLMYLPHLDYGLQKYGPPKSRKGEAGDGGDDARVIADLRDIDAVVQRLVEYYESEQARKHEPFYRSLFFFNCRLSCDRS